MSEQIEKIVTALHKLINGITLSEDEKQEIESWKSRSGYNKDLYDEIKYNPEAIMSEVKSMITKKESQALWKKINKQLPNRKNKLVSLFQSKPLQYAAAVLIILSLSTYFIFTNSTNNKHQTVINDDHQPPSSADIPAGTNGAVLTLSDGKQIILDNTGKGEIAQEGSARVIKSEDGQLVYQLSGNDHSGDEARFNTVSTPKGKQFNIVLPDGSKVWLNSGSSIRYPAVFSNSERRITINGELYFEIAKDKLRPFNVAIASSSLNTGNDNEIRGEVEVLGTHFNINSYSDENAIKTTLLEGSVKVTKNGKNSFLKPGQQAQFANKDNDEIKVISNVDIDNVMAWKNGMFQFQNDDIRTVMRQVERWYDAEVVFEGTSNRKFFADISRSVPVSQLLAALEQTGWIAFRVEGKKITVIPINR